MSVSDVQRERFHTHPWSVGGGGTAELKEQLAQHLPDTLGDMVTEIGSGAVTREDEVFRVGTEVARRQGIGPDHIRLLTAGEDVRDWTISESVGSIWPYDSRTLETIIDTSILRFLWPWRSPLSSRVAYGRSQIERDLQWHEYSMFFRQRFRRPLSISFADVATHNHFVLDRGGNVFMRTASVIKLQANATQDDHLGLLGLLNSSTACFWMKQVFYPKGGDHVGSQGARVRRTLWDERYSHDGTKLRHFPVAEDRPLDLARKTHTLAQERTRLLPRSNGAHRRRNQWGRREAALARSASR